MAKDQSVFIGTVFVRNWEKIDFKNTLIVLKSIDCSFHSEFKTLRKTQAHNASGKRNVELIDPTGMSVEIDFRKLCGHTIRTRFIYLSQFALQYTFTNDR